MEARSRRWLPLLVIGPALVAAWIAAAGDGLSGEVLPPPREEPPPFEIGTSSPAPATAPAQRGIERAVETEYPSWLVWPLTGLLLALVVICAGLVLYAGVHYLLTQRVVRQELDDRPASLAPGGFASEPVRRAVAAGLADLDAGEDPRRAVIACWLRLEQAAAAAGTARLAADTPTDLVHRLLTAHQVSDRALAGLAEAYRSARYGPAAVAEDLAQAARQALREIDAELRGRTLARPPGRAGTLG